MDLELIKENAKGKTYQGDGIQIMYRYSGSISGDNDQNTEEHIYLITGSAEIILVNDTRIANAPTKIVFPAKTYHAITALTDISFVVFLK